jgi:KUP system potassium uptake protein
MMIVTIGLTLIFRKSDNLAAAYGIAVSATMLMTSVLLYMAMREHLRWSLPVSAAVAGCFLIVDVPLALAALIYGVMWLWHSGREAVAKAITENTRRFRTSSRDLNKCECPACREQQFF